MTRAKWEANAFYRNEFRRFTETDIWKHFLGALLNSIPSGFLPGANITDTQAARELGRLEGWREVMSLIDDLSRELPSDLTEETINNDSSYARSNDFKP